MGAKGSDVVLINLAGRHSKVPIGRQKLKQVVKVLRLMTLLRDGADWFMKVWEYRKMILFTLHSKCPETTRGRRIPFAFQ